MSDHVSPSFYNNGSGIGTDTIPGPYHFEGDIRIFPLLSDEDCLQRFVNRYMNDKLDNGTRFDVWGNHVFLITTNFYTMRGASNIGLDTSRSLCFHIPVCFTHKKKTTLGVLQVFTFGRRIPWVLTSREVRGINTSQAEIHVPRNYQTPLSARAYANRLDRQDASIFLEDLVPRNKHSNERGRGKIFLTLQTKVADYLGDGFEIRDDVLIEMVNGYLLPRRERRRRSRLAHEDDTQSSANGSVDGDSGEGRMSDDESTEEDLIAQLDEHLTKWKKTTGDDKEKREDNYNTDKVKPLRKPANDALTGLLTGALPYNIFTLKQFPDAYDGRKACYQALVLHCNYFKKKPKIERIENNCAIRLYNHQSHPIREALGLKAVRNLSPDRRAIELNPQYAMKLKDVDLVEKRGKTLLYRFNREWKERKDVSREDEPTVEMSAENLQLIDPFTLIQVRVESDQTNERRQSDWSNLSWDGMHVMPEGFHPQPDDDYFNNENISLPMTDLELYLSG